MCKLPGTVTELVAFSFLPVGISIKRRAIELKQLNCSNAQFLSCLPAVETMICRLMYKMKVTDICTKWKRKL